MRVNEIRVKRIRVNQGLGVLENSGLKSRFLFGLIFQLYLMFIVLGIYNFE